MIICQLCNKELNEINELWKHLHKYHDKCWSENHGKMYYDKFIDDHTSNHLCLYCREKEQKFANLILGYRKTCCKLHSLKYNGITTAQKVKERGTRNNGWKGKHHSKETIEKIKQKLNIFFESPDGLKMRKERSERQKGKNNTCHRMSDLDKKIANKKTSNTIKKLITEGKFTPCVTNSWANSQCKLLTINGYLKYYRSSWDAAFQILNPQCQYEKTRIVYIDSKTNIKHIYIIDFTDEEKRILYEIKPSKEITKQKNLDKTKYALEWCNKNNFKYQIISDEYFYENAKKINFSLYDKKILNGMKQFL